MSGREWLEAVRNAAREVKAIEMFIERSQMQSNCNSMFAAPPSSAIGDKTAMTAIALIDANERLFVLLDTLIQGEQMARGVGIALGWKVGETVRLRFVEACNWKEISEELECSKWVAMRHIRTAVEYIDTVGIARAMEGKGIAED